jgi:aspartate/methionine/tyrosine aminotransferase
LYLGQVESQVTRVIRHELAEQWTASRVYRDIDATYVLDSQATPRLIKELFNWFFRDDLYGKLRDENHLILSSGSVDEEMYGLPPVLKSCIKYALDMDWYGYSDSRGRQQAREAIAALENVKLPGVAYSGANVAITMGGTFAMSAIADFVLAEARPSVAALCAIPNYPPLVAGMARRSSVRLVPLDTGPQGTKVDALIDAVRPDTPMILLQTITNPTGAQVGEDDLDRLLAAVSPRTVVVLDECHEGSDTYAARTTRRATGNVVRVNSLSKSHSVPGLKVGWITADSRFIDGFYEYASTMYGGPPSFLYTLVEAVARMERWLLEGRQAAGRHELAEFERSYRLQDAELAAAYRGYLAERRWRAAQLSMLRERTTAALGRAGYETVDAPHSINIAVRSPAHANGYLAFRELLSARGVAVFPGALTMCLEPGWFRVTAAGPPAIMSEAVRRLSAVGRLGG